MEFSLDKRKFKRGFQSVEGFIAEIIETLWNYGLPLLFMWLFVLSENPIYIIGILIPMMFNIDISIEGDD